MMIYRLRGKMMRHHLPVRANIIKKTSPKRGFFGGATRNRTGDKGFADLCLTAWLWRRIQSLPIVPLKFWFVKKKSQEKMRGWENGLTFFSFRGKVGRKAMRERVPGSETHRERRRGGNFAAKIAGRSLRSGGSKARRVEFDGAPVTGRAYDSTLFCTGGNGFLRPLRTGIFIFQGGLS